MDFGVVAAAGFGTTADVARSGAPMDAPPATLPPEATGAVAPVSDIDAVRARIGAHAGAGPDDTTVAPTTAPHWYGPANSQRLGSAESHV